jgi:hypothetical protein
MGERIVLVADRSPVEEVIAAVDRDGADRHLGNGELVMASEKPLSTVIMPASASPVPSARSGPGPCQLPQTSERRIRAIGPLKPATAEFGGKVIMNAPAVGNGGVIRVVTIGYPQDNLFMISFRDAML